MSEEKKPVSNPTLENFPQMLQATRLLILDYDVTRYHSFDLFRYVSLEKELFVNCIPEMKPMYKTRDPYEQLSYYFNHANSLNPYDNFTTTANLKVHDMEDKFNPKLKDEALHKTYTDMYHQLGVIFNRSGFAGYLLRYKNDPHRVPWEDTVKVYTSDHVLELNMAVEIIKKHRINAVILSSVEAAIILCTRLEADGYHDSISFIIGGYKYNFDSRGMIKHIREMNLFEYKRKHEFGIFNPFSGLTKEVKQDGDHSGEN
jgi:hypothetical protein